MEISKVDKNSIKIKGKSASILINPVGKQEADIIIATAAPETLDISKVTGVRLIISGPGEYEAGGISISVKKGKDGTAYTIIEGSRILFTTSAGLKNVSGDDEYDGVIIQVTSEFSDDLLDPINTKCAVLYGDLNLAKTKPEAENATKINLKKTSEIQGKTFLFV